MQSSIVSRIQSPDMNPWEVEALKFAFPEQPSSVSSSLGLGESTATRWQQTHDPVIYPGIYSSTGFDLINVLFQISSRPNPQVDIGPVDCSVSLVVCDMDQYDNPIIYATESFCELTNYPMEEVLGRNCRFLQHPPSHQITQLAIEGKNRDAVKTMGAAVASQSEVRCAVINYKKTGKQFVNLLTIIPIQLDNSTNYAVGFLVEFD